MSAFPYLVLLFGFVGLGVNVSGAVPSPTPNPECPGMHRTARSLEKGLKTYTRETTICRVNSACTGLMCNGTHKRNDFYMKMELKHCKTPPSIWLDLVYKDIKVHHELKDGPLPISSKKTPVGTVPIELKLTLKKNRNRITIGLEVQICPLGICKHLATLLPLTTFCLNMKTCPGYNSTGDVPCHINPTGNPLSTMTSTRSPSSSGPLRTTTEQSSSTRPRTYSPTQHSELITTVPTKVVPAKHSSSTLRLSTTEPTQHSGTTAQPGDTHAMKRESGHHHISVGGAVGISIACIVGILIIAGAAFYWKKFYRRSRLRAAYYNDISMNDPLYEDFGPEVA